jgi:hypothetical protein
MRQGSEQHRAHGRSVVRYHRLRWLALALFLSALVFLLIWLLMHMGL